MSEVHPSTSEPMLHPSSAHSTPLNTVQMSKHMPSKIEPQPDAQSSASELPKSYRQGSVRWVALFLSAFLMIGNNYSFDNPQALENALELQLSIDKTQFNLLYTVFAVPNIFLNLIGGVIIDYLGVRFGCLTFSFVVMAGQLIVAFAG